MNSLYQLLPDNHFGKPMDGAIKALIVRRGSACIYGMPGCGLDFFLKMARSRLEKELKGQGEIFFFETYLYPNNIKEAIKKTLVSKLSFNNSNQDFIQAVEGYLVRKRIIIVLAHAQNLMTNQKNALTLLLRLRNLFSDHFSVLSSCDSSIISGNDQYLVTGQDLFSHLIKISPFNFQGTKRILRTNQTFYGFNYPETVFRKIHHLSGGNPALIKHLGQAVDRLGKQVLSQPKVLVETPTLKVKLNDLAQVILSEPKEVLRRIDVLDSQDRIFSPLLALYLKNYELVNIVNLFPQLTKQERKILTYFIKNKNKVIDKDRISFLMGLSEEDFSLWALYKAISRLKNKIKNHYQLVNFKNKGYIIQPIEN